MFLVIPTPWSVSPQPSRGPPHRPLPHLDRFSLCCSLRASRNISLSHCSPAGLLIFFRIKLHLLSSVLTPLMIQFLKLSSLFPFIPPTSCTPPSATLTYQVHQAAQHAIPLIHFASAIHPSKLSSCVTASGRLLDPPV